jgi:hypothetical protein
MESADIVLLLVSAAFLGSEFCYGVELDRAIQRSQSGDAVVIAVMLTPCVVEGTPIAKLQLIPEDGRPITEWPNREKGFKDAAERLRQTVLQWRGKSVAQPVSSTTASAASCVPHKDEGATLFPAPFAGDTNKQTEHLKPSTESLPPPIRTRPLAAGQTFRDTLDVGVEGPLMKIVPAGQFLMGSPSDELARIERESPQHEVRVGEPFWAMSRSLLNA